MIRTGAIFDFKAVDGLIDFARAYPEYAAEAAEAVYNRLSPAFLDELTYTPGKPKYPIEWASEKQRRAFFATDGFGKGIPYQRTGRLQDSWYVRLDRRQKSLSMTVANSVPYAPFVIGDLTPGKRDDPQQRMHLNTGWQPVAATFQFWQGAFAEGFESEFDSLLDTLPIFR